MKSGDPVYAARFDHTLVQLYGSGVVTRPGQYVPYTWYVRLDGEDFERAFDEEEIQPFDTRTGALAP